MANKKKSFFKTRTVGQIRALSPPVIFEQRGLVQRIFDLGEDEAVQLGTKDRTDNPVHIIPDRFYRGYGGSGKEASNQCYKKGRLLILRTPRTIQRAYECRDIPLKIREDAFREKLEPYSEKEEQLDYTGIGWYPSFGTDKRKRKIPFVWNVEGHKIFAYCENHTGYVDPDGNWQAGIEVRPSGCRSLETPPFRARKEGQTIVTKVSSRSQKKSKYTIKLLHVPTEGVTERRAVAWSLNKEYEGPVPEHEMWGNIRYTREEDIEGSNVTCFYPHAIASYIAVIKHFTRGGNLTPIEMSAIPLISRDCASFADKLENNVAVYDPTLSSSNGLRKLNISERSILLGRAAAVFGHNPETGFNRMLYWDGPSDGRFKDYWSVGG